MAAILAACVWSMVVLALSTIAIQTPRHKYHIPLVLVLCFLAFLVSPPLASLHSLQAYCVVLVLGLVALVAVSPCFWLYVCAMTDTGHWRFQRRHIIHLLPVLPAVGLAAAWLVLPTAARQAMLLEGKLVDGSFAMTVAILTWCVILFWMVQSACYLMLSVLRLKRHRQQLLNHFANPEQRQLTWLKLVIVSLITIWLWFLAAGFASNVLNIELMGRSASNTAVLIAVWLLSLWGVIRQPGFAGYDCGALADKKALENPAEHEGAKYQRSALSRQQSSDIAEKIAQHMQQTQMYLQSDLTLKHLADAIHVVPHYVSQTLNDTMGTTFFDYISQRRVEQAKELLLSTDHSVTDIAYEVGFNARSSFYKAFKQVTNTTPSQFRKQ